MIDSPFPFRTRPVRVAKAADGTSWFVARDVAEVLEYPCLEADLLADIPAAWQGTQPVRTPSGWQPLRVLTEEGIYFLLARSDRPRARVFQCWLAGEVLPAIRHRGVYRPPRPMA